MTWAWKGLNCDDNKWIYYYRDEIGSVVLQLMSMGGHSVLRLAQIAPPFAMVFVGSTNCSYVAFGPLSRKG